MNRYWSERLKGIEAYVPGEQLNDRDIIKLNTNENPYPPSPRALKALEEAAHEDLRLYPEPTSQKVRVAVGKFFGINPDWVFAGNGSDEILAFCFQAFFGDSEPLLFNDITYSFYPVYSNFFKVKHDIIPLRDDFSVPVYEFCNPSGGVILPNPNAPTGIALPLCDIEEIVRADIDRVVVIDEAYVDFGAESAVKLVEEYPNLLVVQTASKSRSLAGLRVGWAIGNPELIGALDCVKNCINSYTLGRAAQSAAAAAIADRAYFEETCKRIISTRERTRANLVNIGFEVLDSKANFLFARHSGKSGAEIYSHLRQKKILVRHFDRPRISDFLRITIGTDGQMDRFCEILEEII